MSRTISLAGSASESSHLLRATGTGESGVVTSIPAPLSPIDALYRERAVWTDEAWERRFRSARRKARKRGEFADPCVHGNQIAYCPDHECVSLRLTITGAYL